MKSPTPDSPTVISESGVRQRPAWTYIEIG